MHFYVIVAFETFLPPICVQGKLSKTFGNKYIFKSSIMHFSATVLQGEQFLQHLLASYHLVLRASPLCTFECLLGQQHPQACEQAENNCENLPGMEAHMRANKKSISNPCLWSTNLFTTMSREVYTNDFLFPFPNIKHGGLQNQNNFLAEEIQHNNCA